VLPEGFAADNPHLDAPTMGHSGVGAAVLAGLPRLRLDDCSAARLSRDGPDVCMYCLEALGGGDEVLAFPCPGAHLAHATCSAMWLSKAHTCPACRFELPRGLTPRTLGAFFEHARRRLDSVAAAESQPHGRPEQPSTGPPDDSTRTHLAYGSTALQTAQETAEVLELQHLLASGRPSERERLLDSNR
jgi:predicted RNA-binding Zn-ribbon protein involved in translation (DUF1610 family)